MSAQAGDSLRNAAFALDAPRSLAPVADRLVTYGVPAGLAVSGHVWGFKDGTVFTRAGSPLPGDVALRVEAGAQLSRVYRVLAVFPGDPQVAYAVNQRPWIEDPPGAYRNTVVFEPFIPIASRPYVETMQSFNSGFQQGFNFRGRFSTNLGKQRRS